MPGMFDDLIPAAPKAGGGGGMFDDLIPRSLKQDRAPGEDVTAGMALRGIPVLGAYIPQAEAAIRAAAQPLTGVGEPGATYAERYAKNLPLREADYAKAERESPIASTALQVGGGAAALAPLGATALGARALGATGPMVARIPLGAASGAGIAAADAAARGEDVGTAAGIGGAVGGALPLVGRAVQRAITPFPVRDPGRAGMVAALEREGVQPTAGQQLGNKALQYTESTLGDYPLAGGQATAASERSGQQYTRAALRRLGLQGDDITPAAVDRAVGNIENEFQRLSASTTIDFDRQMGNDIGATMNRYARKLPSQQREVIDNLVNDIVAQGRSMPGDVYQIARSDLSRMAQASRRTDPTYSDALRGLRNALDGAMQRSLTPQERGAWERARRQWTNWRILENAVKNTDAAGNVRITPAQLLQSAATRDRGGFGRGLGDFNELARAGKSILQPLPQSGTTPRAIAAGIMPAIMSPAGLVPAAAGIAAPAIAGRAMMSRPGQAYLRNQLLATTPGAIAPGQAGLLSLPAQQGTPMPPSAPQFAGPQLPFRPGEQEQNLMDSINGPQGYPDFHWVNPAGVDAFLASGPMSTNIEDRRDELGGFRDAAARMRRQGRRP